MSEEIVVKGLIEHWYLLPLFAAFGWWLVKKGIPDAMHLSLTNGSGKIVRTIVDAANAEQSEKNAAKMAKLIREHEQVEEERLDLRDEKLLARFSVLEKRIEVVESCKKRFW